MKWKCKLCGKIIEGDEAELWVHYHFECVGAEDASITLEDFINNYIELVGKDDK